MPTLLRRCIPTHSEMGERWKSRSAIKKHLRIDFNGRCAYCDDADNLVDIDFHIEHFAPKTKFPERKTLYQNLFYACPYCNEAKSEYWVGDNPDENVKGCKGIVNPCTKEYDRHLGRRADGRIYAKTRLGEFMYRRLKLYLLRHELFFRLEVLQAKFDELKSRGAGNEIVALCDELNNYYRLAANAKWKKGRIIGCSAEMKPTSRSLEIKKIAKMAQARRANRGPKDRI